MRVTATDQNKQTREEKKMINIKKMAALFLTAAMTISLAACGGGEKESSSEATTSNSAAGGSAEVEADNGGASGDISIAYIVKAKSDAFWTSMEEGAMKYADEVGVTVDFQAPEKETDVEKQVQFVENAVIKGYNAIILSAADSNALAPAIKKANDAGIPVILVNDTMEQDALDSVGATVETYVGIDQYEAASLAGKYAAENITDGQICYLEGVPGVKALDDRLSGFQDQVGFNIVASQTARCDRNEGFNVMQNVLSSNPDVNVVWAVNAEMGQGAIQAIEQGGFSGKVQVFDFDASPDDIQAIKDGTLSGSVAQYPDLQAAAAIQACLDVLDGKSLDAHTKTKAALITKDNVDAFEAGEAVE